MDEYRAKWKAHIDKVKPGTLSRQICNICQRVRDLGRPRKTGTVDASPNSGQKKRVLHLRISKLFERLFRLTAEVPAVISGYLTR